MMDIVFLYVDTLCRALRVVGVTKVSKDVKEILVSRYALLLVIIT